MNAMDRLIERRMLEKNRSYRLHKRVRKVLAVLVLCLVLAAAAFVFVGRHLLVQTCAHPTDAELGSLVQLYHQGKLTRSQVDDVLSSHYEQVCLSHDLLRVLRG